MHFVTQSDSHMHLVTHSDTVEPVSKDHPIGHKMWSVKTGGLEMAVASQDRFYCSHMSLVTYSLTVTFVW